MTFDFDRELEMLNEQQIKDAVATLSKSETGQQALSHLYTFLDRSAILDEAGKNAALTLIAGCYGGHAGTTLDAMRDALEENGRWISPTPNYG